MNTYYQIAANHNPVNASARLTLPPVMKFSTVDARGCGGTFHLQFKPDWTTNRVMVDDGGEQYPLTEGQQDYLEYLAAAYEGEFITPEGTVFKAKLC